MALRLLSSHPSTFLTGLSPPPSVFLVSPWSPPLPATDPLAYRQLLDWIPSGLLMTQDTTIPVVFSAVRGAEEAYDVTSKAVGGAVTAIKSWLGGLGASAPAAPARSIRSLAEEVKEDGGGAEMPEVLVDGPPSANEGSAGVEGEPQSETREGEEEPKRRRLWAPSAKYVR